MNPPEEFQTDADAPAMTKGEFRVEFEKTIILRFVAAVQSGTPGFTQLSRGQEGHENFCWMEDLIGMEVVICGLV